MSYEPTSLELVCPARGVALPTPTERELADAFASMKAPSTYLVEKYPAAAEDGDRARRARTRPTTRAGAMVLLSMLPMLPPWAHVRALVSWLADAEFELAFYGLMHYGPVLTDHLLGYGGARRSFWQALGLWLCRAPERSYQQAREVASTVRVTAPHPLRAAIDKLFASEPWATDDARGFDVRDSESAVGAGLLLAANRDESEAKRLAAAVAATAHTTLKDELRAAAAPMLYRFEAAIQDVLIAAATAELDERFPSSQILDALVGLGTPEVAKFMATRRAKKLGGAQAERFFAKHPELAVEAPSRAWPPGRTAIHGILQMHGGDLAEWQRLMLRKPARRISVRKILPIWQHYRDGNDWLDIAIDRTAIEVRGVLSEATIERGALELFGLFRTSGTAEVRFTGYLTVFCPASGRGLRLLATDDAIDEWVESNEVREIDEPHELAARLDALLATTT